MRMLEVIVLLAPFMAAVGLSACLEMDFEQVTYEIGEGQDISLGPLPDVGLEVLEFTPDVDGVHEFQVSCGEVTVTVFEEGEAVRTASGNGEFSFNMLLSIDSNYAVVVDREHSNACTIGIYYDDRASATEAGTNGAVDAMGGDDINPVEPEEGEVESVPMELQCESDDDCGAREWCSTVEGLRACSPRLFDGTPEQMDFVFVPSGTFQQGTPGATNEERPYSATISRNYFVSRTEVTQGQWKAATGGTNPSCFQSTTGSTCSTSNANNSGPVEQVDWYSTLAYANWLSTNQGLAACYTLTPSTCADSASDWADGDTDCNGATFTGLNCTGYRLLTESEWERAARGGTTRTYYWGEATDTSTVGLNAWFSSNAGSRTQAVSGKQMNVFGLFDMSGNVWEWVWDWVYSGSAFINYPSGSATDYIGPASGSLRGIRGGSWLFGASDLRSALRNFSAPSVPSLAVGFRLGRTAN